MLCFSFISAISTPRIADAATGINHQISFQGKLVNPDGTNVTDGSYSIVFSIYSVATAGSAIWTETQSVVLSNGIFQVNLGSVTTLPGSIDFNTDNIYLGIKVGADAEMTPRVQFTAVPQAFNAEKLGGLDKTGFIQNSTSMQSSANLYIQSGAIGNVTAKLRAFTGQTADILQVRDSGDTTTVFAISPAGTITAGTWNGTAITDAFVSDTLTVGSAGTVDWQALNNYPAACSAGSAITTLGDSVTCSPFLTAEADTLATVTGRGATTSTAVTFSGGATIRGVTVDSATATQDRILVGISAVASAARFDGTITNADLTAARTWTFQDNSGVVALGTAANSLFFTTTGATNVTLPTSGTLCSTATCLTAEADTLATVTGRGATTTTASSFTGGATVRGLTVDSATANTDKILVTVGGAGAGAVFNGSFTNNDLTAARTWTLQDNSGVVALGTAANSLFFTTTGATNVTLPTSGTLCSTATCVTAEADTLASVTGRGATTATASSFTGGATIRGLTVDSATGTNDKIALSVTTTAGSSFTGSITNADLTAARTYTLQDSSGVIALGTAANSLFFTTTGATNVTLPTSGTLCTTTSCGTGGSGYVQFAPASVQTDTTTNSSIFINKTGASGNILQLQNGGTDVFTINNSGSVVVGAGKSLTITGSGTRPGSPTAGMLYYDTTTNQLLQWNGTKWVADHTPTTKIIAPSNASQTAKDAADVVLTGTADQTLINTALTAAAGGKVYIMEGTVSVTGSISVPNNTTLAGAGRGTLITIPNATNLAINMITNTTTGGSGTGVVIQDMQLDGNRANNLTATTYGVYLNGIGSGITTQGAKVNGMWINNFHGGAVFLTSSSNSVITNNTTINNYDRGFSITSGSNNVITGNISQTTPYGYYLDTATNNTLSGNAASGSANDGFRLTANSNNNTVSSNTSDSAAANNFIVTGTSNNNTFTGNTSANGGTDGFAVFSNYNTFTGNTSFSDNSALFDIGASFNTITGNTLRGDSTSFYGFQLNSANSNTISNNTITDTGANTTNNAISISTSDSNTITGNTITDTTHTTSNVAIDITNSSSDTNYLSNNTLGGASISDLGTGTIYGGQVDSTGRYEIQPSNGTLIQASTTTTTTLQVQTAAGANLIQVSTATNNNLITNPSLEFNTTGWNARTGTTLTRTTAASNYYYGVAAAQGVNTATASAGINYPIVLTANTTYTISVMLKMTVTGLVTFGYAADGATETTFANANANANGSAGAWQQSCLSFTTPATVNAGAYIFLKQNDSSARTMYLDGLRAESGVSSCAIGGGGSRYQENQINLGPAGTSVLIGASDSNIPTNLNAALFVQQNRGAKGLVVRGTPENDFSPTIFEVQNSAGTQLLGVNNLTDNVQIYGGSAFYGTPALIVRPDSPSVIGIEVIGAVNQTANLYVGTNSSGADVFTVGATGDVKIGAAGIMPTTTKSVKATSSGTFATKVDYSTDTNPQGITSADFNGDGKTDVAFTNNGSGKNTLSVLINNGDGTFAARVNYATGLRPFGITSADFNGDGYPDLAVTNNNGATGTTMSVLINNGNGTFAAKVDYTTGTAPLGITSADFNGDGKPDLAVTNNSSNTISVFFNSGTGTFTLNSSPATGTNPQGITSADFNGDGKPDLAVSNLNSTNMSVFINTGTGTFAAGVTYATGASPYDITSADFNGDGKPDLAVANRTANTVSVFFNSGTGTFTLNSSPATGTNPDKITSADFNGDGYPDLVVTNNNGATGTTMSVIINNGNGTFAAKVDSTTGTSPKDITAADFDSDGFPDIAVVNNVSNTVSVFINNVSSGFSSSTTTQLSAKTTIINDSGKVGLLIQGASTSDNIFQAQDSTGELLASIDGTGKLTVGGGPVYQSMLTVDQHLAFAAKVDYATGTAPAMPATADFNRDGRPDLAVTNATSNTVSVFINNGNGTYATKVDSNAGTGAYGVAAADFNGDGYPDLAVTNNGTTTVSIFLNNGNGTFPLTASSTATTGAGPSGITAADFNGDGKPDLAVVNSSSNTVSIFINNGTGTFAAKVDSTTGTVPVDVTAADFNGDGSPDIAVTNNTGTSVSVFLNTGSGTFPTTASSSPTTGTGPYGIVTADLNNDGKPDLAVVNQSANTVSVLMNAGSGTFAAKVDYATGTAPRYATATDFNGDGKPDLAVANYNSNTGTTMSILLNNGTGTFATKADFTTGTGPRGITSADFNGDGKNDIATPNNASTTVSVFINSSTALSGPSIKGTLSVTVADRSSGGLYIQGVANQTADYLNIQNSSGTELLSVNSSGALKATNQVSIDGQAGNGLTSLSIKSNSGAVTQLITADSTFTATSGWASNTILTSTGEIMLIPSSGSAPVAGFGLTVDTTGDVQIQGTSSYGGYNLAVTSSGGVAAFNTTNAAGGATVVAFLQSGTVQGTVSINGATTSYNAFTGSHYAKIDNNSSLNRGELASLTGNNAYAQGAGEPVYGITKTTTANDPNVLGAFLGLEDTAKGFSLEYPYLVMAAGNGDMWVADNGTGNVVIGDPLISSTVAGHAMRDPKTFAISHVIAKAAEGIDWSNITQTVNGVKVAKVSVLFSYYDADNITTNLQAGTLNVSGTATLASLTVTGDTTLQGKLTVLGDVETRNITINGHIITSGNAPVVAIGDAVGQVAANESAPVAAVDGNDSAGTLSITTGSQNLTSGVLAHINFAQAFGGSYKIVLSASNDPAGLLRVHTVKTSTGFDIVANDVVNALTQYEFDYIVLGSNTTQ